MRPDAALPQPDQWERDLTDLLGLAHTAERPRRRARRWLAPLLGAGVVAAACLALGSIGPRWGGRIPPGASTVSKVAERSVFSSVPVVAPVATVVASGQEVGAADAPATNGPDKPTPRAASGRRLASSGTPRSGQASPASGRPDAARKDRPVAAFLARVDRNSVAAVTRPEPGHARAGAYVLPADIAAAAASDRRAGGGFVANPAAPAAVAREAPVTVRETRVDQATSPASPGKRQSQDRGSKTEAIDAIRLLRRQ